jgi:hypothetical protein
MIGPQHAVLVDGMKVTHPYSSEQIKSLKRAVNGGIIIFSRYPIVHQHQEVFTECTDSDAFSAKGFSHTVLDIFGQHIHVIGTHTQAWYSNEHVRIRHAQFRQIRAYVDTLNIPDSEPLFYAGDMNVDLYTDTEEMHMMLDILDASLPEINIDKNRFTVDPPTNQLVGNDEDTMYGSEEYPNGCYDEYMKTLSCPCAPRVWYDYVLVSNRGAQPSQTSLRCHPLKTSLYSCEMSISTRRATTDLSDHYPVILESYFPTMQPVEVPEVYIDENKNNKTENIIVITVSVLACLIIILVILTIYPMCRWCWYRKHKGTRSDDECDCQL